MNNETQNTPKEDFDELFAEYISNVADQIKNALIECAEDSEKEATEETFQEGLIDEISPFSNEHEDYYRDQRHQEEYDAQEEAMRQTLYEYIDDQFKKE